MSRRSSATRFVCSIALRNFLADILVGRVPPVPTYTIAVTAEIHHRAHVVAHILAYLVAVVEHHQAVHHLWLSADEARHVLNHVGYESQLLFGAFYAPFALRGVFLFAHCFSVFVS